MVDGEHVDAEELLRQADIAMYRGKREGRNKVVIFEPSMEQAVIARAELEAELRPRDPEPGDLRRVPAGGRPPHRHRDVGRGPRPMDQRHTGPDRADRASSSSPSR